MKSEHHIIRLVQQAKEDMQAADQLIADYLPFIRSETAKFLHRPVIDELDDEFSVAMIAFHEAIRSYSQLRGSFFRYAAMLIRSRLIDHQRREQRHSGHLSLDASLTENDATLLDTIADPDDHSEALVIREATRSEINELSAQMEDFGISLTDVAENCPRQRRTLMACRKALQYAAEHREILDDLLRTKRLPIAKLSEGSGIDRKTLERHRKYMVALLLIQTNGYEIIRGHIVQVLKGGVSA